MILTFIAYNNEKLIIKQLIQLIIYNTNLQSSTEKKILLFLFIFCEPSENMFKTNIIYYIKLNYYILNIILFHIKCILC